MNFPVQHLSDEAVAAYADGVLGRTARMRAVPVTTILTSPPLALSPDGSAAFPAHGTSIAERDDTATMSAHPMGLTPSIAPRPRRYARFGSVGMATVVAVAA